MMMASLTLLSPTWLWALLPAVAGPLLAHLLSRRRAVPALFPTIRFLREAVEQGRRHLRLRDRLLLALRCLILGLIVLAFARPVWERATIAAVDEGAGRHVVIVLDRSASMNRTVGGTTLFEQGRNAADQTLAALDPGRDLVSIVLVDSRPGLLAGEPTAAIGSLRQRLSGIDPTWQRAAADRALELARLELHRAREGPMGARRAAVVEVFSDLQQSAWPARSLAALGGKAVVRLHRLGEGEANLAVSGPRLSPPRPLIGFESSVSVELSNFADEGRTVTVTVEGGIESVSRRVDLHAGETRRIAMMIELAEPGLAMLTASLEPADGFKADNRTGLAAQVAPARRVAVATALDGGEPSRSAALVMEALAPQWSQERDNTTGGYVAGPHTPIAVAALGGDEVAALLGGDGELGVPDMLVLCGTGELPRQAMQAMAGFLRGGGGVLWVVDSTQAAEAVMRLAEDVRLGLQPPVIVEEGFNTIEDRTQWPGLVPGDGDDPLVDLLREGGLRRALSGAGMGAVLDARLADGAEAILRFEDGRPALATRRVGDGRLTILAGDLHPQRNTLIRQRLFPMLIQELAHGHGGGQVSLPPPRPGQMLSIELPPGEREGDGPRRYRVLGPDGETVVEGELERGQSRIEVGRAERPGPYVVAWADGEPFAGTWVELDPQESDFRPLPEDALSSDRGAEEAADDQGLTGVAGDGPRGIAVNPATPQRTELWPWLLATALLLAAGEAALVRLIPARAGEGGQMLKPTQERTRAA